ncbi:MAG TPA: aldo/keto reductase, partial [Thermoplasmata archaeon]|nr:aldo/keto reductase [Thermoplasmata archaeon]
MPVLGLGVWQAASGKETRRAVDHALKIGYRLFDTAKLYGNERDVGAAVRESGIPREEIFVTTKLWNDDHGYERALRAFERSRKELGLDYVDLYLIHWPESNLRGESWKAFLKLKEEGL